MTELAGSRPLPDLPLFRGLAVAELEALSAGLHRKAFPATTAMLTAELPGEAIYLLLEGTVKIYIDRSDGSEVILALLGAGDVLGEMSLVDSIGHSANVVTLERCDTLWMERLAFRRALRSSSRLAYNLMQILTARLRLANEQILSLSTLDVGGRVARQLLAFAERYGEQQTDGSVHIPLRLKQGDLAGLVGASRERVNRSVVWLKESGLVSVDGKLRFTVHDAPALAERCR